MTEAEPSRLLGAALGASATPAAMCGANWSGLGWSALGAWCLTFAAGGLIGWLTWSQFATRGGAGLWFSPLFGGCAGLLAGALVGGPVGGVFGMCGGSAAGLPAAITYNALDERGVWMRGGGALVSGSVVAVVVGWGMTL
jgi:hypothetical protein